MGIHVGGGLRMFILGFIGRMSMSVGVRVAGLLILNGRFWSSFRSFGRKIRDLLSATLRHTPILQ